MLPQHMHKSMLNATTGMQVSWPSRLEHNFTQDDLILGAFNSLYKLDPRTWDIWMQIMQRYSPASYFAFALLLLVFTLLLLLLSISFFTLTPTCFCCCGIVSRCVTLTSSRPLDPHHRLPQTNIWMLFFDDVAPHTLRRLAEEAGVGSARHSCWSTKSIALG